MIEDVKDAHGASCRLLDRLGDGTVDAWAKRMSERRVESERVRLGAAIHSVRAVRREDLPKVVEAAGDENAARLLADLVRDGIRVTAFTPSQGALESAYLAATEDRR